MESYHYKHNVHYYETDKMGITHHSNYTRFMEEARISMLEALGYGYEKMEEEGVVSPVMAITTEFKKPTTYPDVIDIEVRVAELLNFKIKFDYKMRVGEQLVCHATSLHCFLTREGRPIVMADRFPDLVKILSEMLITK